MDPKSDPKSGNMSASGDYIPDAGDIVKVNFSPTKGTEQAEYRRAIIITSRDYNAKVGRCFACPTSSQDHGYPFDVALPKNFAVTGVILCDQGKPLDYRACRLVLVTQAPTEILDAVRVMMGTFLEIP